MSSIQDTVVDTATGTVVPTVISPAIPFDGGALLLEDGVSYFLLEDDLSKLLLG